MILRKGEGRMPAKAVAALVEAIKIIVRQASSIEEILKALDDIQSRLIR